MQHPSASDRGESIGGGDVPFLVGRAPVLNVLSIVTSVSTRAPHGDRNSIKMISF